MESGDFHFNLFIIYTFIVALFGLNLFLVQKDDRLPIKTSAGRLLQSHAHERDHVHSSGSDADEAEAIISDNEEHSGEDEDDLSCDVDTRVCLRILGGSLYE